MRPNVQHPRTEAGSVAPFTASPEDRFPPVMSVTNRTPPMSPVTVTNKSQSMSLVTEEMSPLAVTPISEIMSPITDAMYK